MKFFASNYVHICAFLKYENASPFQKCWPKKENNTSFQLTSVVLCALQMKINKVLLYNSVQKVTYRLEVKQIEKGRLEL